MTATPADPPPALVVHLPDVAHSDALGAKLATVIVAGFAEPHEAAFDGFTIHFSGDLGAGKTTIVRSLLRALGVEGRIKSPTYTLVESYQVVTRKNVESRLDVNLYCYHFDFYRFEDPQEWLEAGFRDYFSDAALRLVEWPERAASEAGSLLPVPDLHVTLEARGDGRRALLAHGTTRGASWLAAAPWARLPTAPDDDSSAAA